jgi:hypothetical protein
LITDGTERYGQKANTKQIHMIMQRVVVIEHQKKPEEKNHELEEHHYNGYQQQHIEYKPREVHCKGLLFEVPY